MSQKDDFSAVDVYGKHKGSRTPLVSPRAKIKTHKDIFRKLKNASFFYDGFDRKILDSVPKGRYGELLNVHNIYVDMFIISRLPRNPAGMMMMDEIYDARFEFTEGLGSEKRHKLMVKEAYNLSSEIGGFDMFLVYFVADMLHFFMRTCEHKCAKDVTIPDYDAAYKDDTFDFEAMKANFFSALSTPLLTSKEADMILPDNQGIGFTAPEIVKYIDPSEFYNLYPLLSDPQARTCLVNRTDDLNLLYHMMQIEMSINADGDKTIYILKMNPQITSVGKNRLNKENEDEKVAYGAMGRTFFNFGVIAHILNKLPLRCSIDILKKSGFSNDEVPQYGGDLMSSTPVYGDVVSPDIAGTISEEFMNEDHKEWHVMGTEGEEAAILEVNDITEDTYIKFPLRDIAMTITRVRFSNSYHSGFNFISRHFRNFAYMFISDPRIMCVIYKKLIENRDIEGIENIIDFMEQWIIEGVEGLETELSKDKWLKYNMKLLESLFRDPITEDMDEDLELIEHPALCVKDKYWGMEIYDASYLGDKPLARLKGINLSDAMERQFLSHTFVESFNNPDTVYIFKSLGLSDEIRLENGKRSTVKYLVDDKNNKKFKLRRFPSYKSVIMFDSMKPIAKSTGFNRSGSKDIIKSLPFDEDDAAMEKINELLVANNVEPLSAEATIKLVNDEPLLNKWFIEDGDRNFTIKQRKTDEAIVFGQKKVDLTSQNATMNFGLNESYLKKKTVTNKIIEHIPETRPIISAALTNGYRRVPLAPVPRFDFDPQTRNITNGVLRIAGTNYYMLGDKGIQKEEKRIPQVSIFDGILGIIDANHLTLEYGNSVISDEILQMLADAGVDPVPEEMRIIDIANGINFRIGSTDESDNRTWWIVRSRDDASTIMIYKDIYANIPLKKWKKMIERAAHPTVANLIKDKLGLNIRDVTTITTNNPKIHYIGKPIDKYSQQTVIINNRTIGSPYDTSSNGEYKFRRSVSNKSYSYRRCDFIILQDDPESYGDFVNEEYAMEWQKLKKRMQYMKHMDKVPTAMLRAVTQNTKNMEYVEQALESEDPITRAIAYKRILKHNPTHDIDNDETHSMVQYAMAKYADPSSLRTFYEKSNLDSSKITGWKIRKTIAERLEDRSLDDYVNMYLAYDIDEDVVMEMLSNRELDVKEKFIKNNIHMGNVPANKITEQVRKHSDDPDKLETLFLIHKKSIDSNTLYNNVYAGISLMVNYVYTDTSMLDLWVESVQKIKRLKSISSQSEYYSFVIDSLRYFDLQSPVIKKAKKIDTTARGVPTDLDGYHVISLIFGFLQVVKEKYDIDLVDKLFTSQEELEERAYKPEGAYMAVSNKFDYKEDKKIKLSANKVMVDKGHIHKFVENSDGTSNIFKIKIEDHSE